MPLYAMMLCASAFLPLVAPLPRSAVVHTHHVRPQLRATEAPSHPILMSAAAQPSKPAGATVTSSIVNLSKNIVGSGVLALAAGVAAFSASPMALVPGLALLLFLGAASGYSFSLIARIGDEVGADTYRDSWAKIFGSRLSIIPALTIVFKTYVGGLAYSIILGDSLASIAALAGAPAALRSSNVWICLLSAFVLLPLSLMRDLSSLAIGSVQQASESEAHTLASLMRAHPHAADNWHGGHSLHRPLHVAEATRWLVCAGWRLPRRDCGGSTPELCGRQCCAPAPEPFRFRAGLHACDGLPRALQRAQVLQ